MTIGIKRFLRKLLFVLALLFAQTVVWADKPNIIFFFCDDLGYGDTGCFWQDGKTGDKFDTPALDKMAAEGVMMTHHYVAASVCAPSRGSLLTGRHQGHCEIRNNQFDKALPLNHTIGSLLKEAGYYTAFIGKGGLAGSENNQLVNYAGTQSMNLPGHPMKQGFDHFFGYHFHNDGHHHYPKNGTTSKVSVIYDDYQQVVNHSQDLYTTDAWTAAAKKVIIDEYEDADDQPFFIYLAYDTPHTSLHIPAVAYPPLDSDGDPRTGGIQWTMATDGSGKVRYASTATGSGSYNNYYHPSVVGSWSDNKKRHVTMIRRIDNSIADIINTLEEIGVADNTLLLFASDNGPHGASSDDIHKDFESFANFEGIKRDLLEGGIRTPMVVRWPDQITGSGDESNIREITYPSGLWDWMPTFSEIVGLPAPAWCDGVSLIPTLTGTGTQRDKGYLYFEYYYNGKTKNWPSYFPNHANERRDQQQCIRIGDYMGIRKPVSSGTENFEIYNVVSDTGQGTNLAASMPDLQQQMKNQVIWARRPLADASRVYDSLNLPALTLAQKSYGVKWKSYTGPFPWVPEFRDMTPVTEGKDVAFDPSTHAPADNTGILYEGYIFAPRDGSYTFYLTTDDGGSFFIHDAHVIDDDFHHDGSEVSASVNLEAGYHPYRLYYKHGTGGHVLSVKWAGPEFTKQVIPQDNLFIDAPMDGDLTLDNRVNIDDLYEMAIQWVTLYDLLDHSDISRNWLFSYPPMFTSDPIIAASAQVDTAYSSSIAGDVYYHYPQMPALSKVSGPAWLNVTADGTLSGTPDASNLGMNSFLVQADEEGTFVQAELQISVLEQLGLLTWTGAGDGVSLFQEANWDLDGNGAPPAGTVDKDVAVVYDMLVQNTNDNVGGTGATGHLKIGDGFTLTVHAGKVVLKSGDSSNNYGIKGISGGEHTYLDLIGGKVVAQYLSNDIAVSLSGDASLKLKGGGNPINGSTVEFTSGTAQLELPAETVADFTSEHLSKITVNGAAAVIGSNLSVVSDGAAGCIVTAVP